MNEEEKFTLPITKKEVVIKGYVSGAIDAEIKAIVQGGYNVETDFDADETTEKVTVGKSKMRYNAGVTAKANQRAMELMLISLDGSTEDVYKRVMDLPAGDTKFVADKIDEITDKSQIKEDVKKN